MRARLIAMLLTGLTWHQPAASARKHRHECTVASDCRGMLPKSCRVCDDGKSQCAHFVCVEGRCETRICD